jgi:hypothetical protein
LEVDEERNIVGPLFTPGQLSEDEEASPSLAGLGDAHTLPDGSHGLEVAFRHTAGLDDAYCAVVAVQEEDVGDDDGDGEDPLGNLERDGRLDLAGPVVEGEQIDGGEAIGQVDGARDDDEDPQPDVGERREAGGRLEVGQVLYSQHAIGLVGRVYTHDVVPLLLVRDDEALFAVAAAPHSECW